MNNTPDNISSDTIDPDLIHAICQAYQLGKCLSSPQPCLGGLLHRVWRINTTAGQFIIKLLNPAIINQSNIAERYRITEQIARGFKKQISAISALTHQADPLFYFEDQVAMIFPYINASTVKQGEVTLEKSAQIGTALAQIHTTNIHINNAPAIDILSVDILLDLMNSDEQKEMLANKSAKSKLIVKLLHDCKHIIKDLQKNEKIHAAKLKNNLIISHRDCDPKNVLWNESNDYYIIDWESAGLINKTKDLLVTAIYWSFDDQYHVEPERLRVFLKAYQDNKGMINRTEITAGLHGLLSDWISWLDFNVLRMLNNAVGSDEFKRGEAEASKTMTALPILFNQLPTIIGILEEI